MDSAYLLPAAQEVKPICLEGYTGPGKLCSRWGGSVWVSAALYGFEHERLCRNFIWSLETVGCFPSVHVGLGVGGSEEGRVRIQLSQPGL